MDTCGHRFHVGTSTVYTRLSLIVSEVDEKYLAVPDYNSQRDKTVEQLVFKRKRKPENSECQHDTTTIREVNEEGAAK